MFREQRELLAHPGFFGLYLAIAILGAHTERAKGIVFALMVMASVAFIAWMLSLRRLLAMSGTPTSRIASAAQGYVEIVGRGANPPGFPVVSFLTSLPCLWYRYVIEERTDNKWKEVSSGRSMGSFVINDGSGACLVDPEHAEVLPRNKEVWVKDGHRYTEWLILPHDKVYVLGEFSTLGGETAQLDAKRDIGEMLAEWKRNQPKLLERFDLDKDGMISDKEWALARSQARREVSKAHTEIRTQPGTHILHKPRDGRLFLISNIDQSKLVRRYRFWALAHLAVLVAAIATAAWFGRPGVADLL